MTNQAIVILTDGSIMSAPTWRELELQLRQNPWNPKDKGTFREEMQWRAWQWSRTVVEITDITSYELFEQMEAAGMLRIVREEDGQNG